MVGRDKVHQAEAQAFHLHQRRDIEGLFERSMCLDQHMNRNVTRNACRARCLVDVVGHAGHFDDIGDLGHDHVGNPRPGRAHQHVDILLPVRMSRVMDAHAHAVVSVERAVDETRAQFGVLALPADCGAVLAVEGDIEDGAKLLLQGQRLEHQLFAARVVVAHRQLDWNGFALEQDLGRMHLNSGQKGVGGRPQGRAHEKPEPAPIRESLRCPGFLCGQDPKISRAGAARRPSLLPVRSG